MERSKDTMIVARSTIRGKNSKGGDRTQLYFSPENAEALIAVIQGSLGSPSGVKLDIHTTKKTNTNTNKQFDSTILFVKGVEAGANAGASVERSAGPSTNDKIASLKAAQVKA